MHTHPKTRLDILIDAAVKSRLAEMLEAQGVSGFTVFSAVGGSGLSGDWMRAAQITDVGQMLLFVCILDRDRRTQVLDAVFERFAGQIGYVAACDVDVIRPTKFP